MGLLDQLQQQGSAYSEYNGTQPPVNPLATAQSKLHADGAGVPGYSLNGNFSSQVNTDYNAYLDGVTNVVPFPSNLDTNGTTPTPYLQNPPQ
jgi:hypothetical protein